MYIEASGLNFGQNVSVSLKSTDNIQISFVTFYFFRFSARDHEVIGRLLVELFYSTVNGIQSLKLIKILNILPLQQIGL